MTGRPFHAGLGAMALVGLMGAATHAAESAAQPTFVVSEGGQVVADARTELVWSRCVEGMRWNGKTCAGEPQWVSHLEALALAKTRAKADGLPWRVPRLKELQALFQKGRLSQTEVDALFPGAPATWYWTGTAVVNTKPVNQYHYKNIQKGVNAQNAASVEFLHGWAVHAISGESRGDVLRRQKMPVRLVFTLDEEPATPRSP